VSVFSTGVSVLSRALVLAWRGVVLMWHGLLAELEDTFLLEGLAGHGDLHGLREDLYHSSVGNRVFDTTCFTKAASRTQRDIPKC
jgi:hypothetical protein